MTHYRTELSQDGHTVHHYLTGDPWQILRKMSNVLCDDGISRTVTVPISGADSFWTIRGKTQVRGKTVSGYVAYDDDAERFMFHACGRNAEVIA